MNVISLRSLGHYLGNLRLLLTQQRVGKVDTYSIGEWIDERRGVKITKAVGKWNLFGYVEDQNRFVEGYEALHLMELNRLVVYWNSVVISLEQAYTLFLGYPGSISLEEYQVYNTLMRAGFYVLKCNSGRSYETKTVQDKQLDIEEQCVWNNLYELLNQSHLPKNVSDCNTTTEMYQNVRSSMLNIGHRIMAQIKVDNCTGIESEGGSAKRRVSDSNEDECMKRNKVEQSSCESTFRTRLEQVSNLFQTFDIIKNSLDDLPELSTEVPQSNLLFDLFCIDGSIFRKSKPVPPDYRILVRTSNEEIPSAAEIAHLYRTQQKPAVPILLMLVSDTLSIHCFLYNFYRLPSKLITVSYPSSARQEDFTSAEYLESDDDT
ncbi:uncharacterized protein LOC131437960 isoform X2 [Malaya genurostris]|uniref:uncharacterized protein LOC131437960 isoform X2 n=1 Tax=Malaya genurostris TaxID=325434 RepID=UPI0026F3E481|nr:uncharacterized protein LOC131437960 isoform X2 [Malaya genurostris]